MKSAIHQGNKKRNLSNNGIDKPVRISKKDTPIANNTNTKDTVPANELFLHFTANIIKEDTLFTR